MVRPADQETTDVEKVVCYSQFPRGRGHGMPHRATQRGTRVGQEAEGMRGKCRQEPFMGSMKGR